MACEAYRETRFKKQAPAEPCCVDSSTQVLVADLSWRSAGAVQVGEELVGVDATVPGPKKQRRLRRTKVTAIHRFAASRCVVDTDQGAIVVTPNHQFLVTRCNGRGEWNNGWYWVNASKLNKRDRIARLCRLWTPLWDRDAGWLAGLYDGEGCVTNARRIGALFATVYQAPGIVLDKARLLLKLYGFYGSETLDKNSGVIGLKTYGVDRIIELLGALRPERLIQTFQRVLDAGTAPAKSKTPALVRVCTPTSDGTVIGIETSTKTLITHGFVSRGFYRLRSEIRK